MHVFIKFQLDVPDQVLVSGKWVGNLTRSFVSVLTHGYVFLSCKVCVGCGVNLNLHLTNYNLID